MKNYISFGSQIRPITYPLIVFIVISIYFSNIINDAWHTEYRLFSLIIYFFLLVYTLVIPIYVHLNYLKNDNRTILTINNSEERITCKKKSKLIVTDVFQNISRLEIHQVHKYKERSVNWFSWSAYYYYKLIFNNGEVLYVSRLVIKDLENKLGEIKIEYVNHFIPLIPPAHSAL